MERNFNTLGSSTPYEDVEWETLLPLDIDDHDHNDFIDDESGVAVPMPMPVPAPMRSSESDDDHETAKDQRQPLMMIRKGQWTSQEDSKLSACVALYGQGRWNSLARLAGLNRSGKSCRLRWLNYLSPDLRHDNFTLEEQLNILQLHLCFGKRWSKIAQHLPGRTDNQIKNYWRTKVQRLAKHLKCDVNSPQFNNALIHTWIPTLKERIEAGSRSNSIIAQSLIGPNTDQSPIHCCGHEPLDCYTEPNCSDFSSLSHKSWAPYWYTNGPTGLISEPSIYLKPSEAQDSVNLDRSANNLGYNQTWNESPNNMWGTLAYDEDNMLPPAHHCPFYSSEHIYHYMA